ncbi:MAG TPA: hypothetical protein VE777_22170, partial [Gaiellales bacterium]|nr:hypothetical protein [Gaiellales bacterium]
AGAFADPQAQARGVVSEYEHPQLGTVRVPRPAVRGGRGDLGRAPARGEHTDEVLREVCGYGEDTIAALRASGALG